MADYSFTLTVSEQERAWLEAKRGETSFEEFARNALLLGALEAAADFPVPSEDELTPADHIRLAEAADANAVEIDDLEKLVWQDIRAYQAERSSH